MAGNLCGRIRYRKNDLRTNRAKRISEGLERRKADGQKRSRISDSSKEA